MLTSARVERGEAMLRGNAKIKFYLMQIKFAILSGDGDVRTLCKNLKV